MHTRYLFTAVLLTLSVACAESEPPMSGTYAVVGTLQENGCGFEAGSRDLEDFVSEELVFLFRDDGTVLVDEVACERGGQQVSCLESYEEDFSPVDASLYMAWGFDLTWETADTFTGEHYFEMECTGEDCQRMFEMESSCQVIWSVEGARVEGRDMD